MKEPTSKLFLCVLLPECMRAWFSRAATKIISLNQPEED